MVIIIKRVGAALLALLLIVLIFGYVMTGLTFTFDEGEFDGIKIGATKQSVLNQLKENQAISSLKVDIEEWLSVNYQSVENIQRLFKYNKFSIRKATKFLFMVHLDDKQVVKVNRDEDYTGDIAIEVGMSRENLGKYIQRKLVEDTSLVALPEEERRRLEVKNLSGEDIQYLFTYDAWGYWEKNSYSYTRVYFTDGMVSKVKFYWIPIELP